MGASRVRITFAKGEAIKYTSHLDLMRVWERGLRRAGAPLAYSRGFNPRPRLQLAAALPLGHTGEAEVLDVWLERPMSVADLARALAGKLPTGLVVTEVRQVGLKEPALQTRVISAEYRVTVECYEAREAVEGRVAALLSAADLPRERRGRRYNLRPLIEGLWLERAAGGEVVLGMRLAARPGATARPEAVLEALGMGEAPARCHRRRLILADDRASEPLGTDDRLLDLSGQRLRRDETN